MSQQNRDFPWVRDLAPATHLHYEGASCVLGRLIEAMDEVGSFEARDYDPGFPSHEAGARALGELGVPQRYAEELARQIVLANDSRDFRRAWRLLDIAHRLVYREFRRRQRERAWRRPLVVWAEWYWGEGARATELAEAP